MENEGNPEIDAHGVRRALADILQSPSFVDSPRMQAFLGFVVEKTLEGNSSDIKAYTIAVDALGYPENFDPQTNAVVRVAAGRLRKALALYHAEHPGSDAPVYITLPAGSYVPVFEAKTVEDSEMNPTVAAPVVADQATGQFHKKRSSTPFWKRHSGILASILCLALVLAGLVFYFVTSFSGGLEPDSKQAAETRILREVDANRRPRIAASVLFPDATYPGWFKPGEFSDSLAVVMAKFDDYQFTDVFIGDSPRLNGELQTDYQLLVTAYGRDEILVLFGKLIREIDGTVIWSTQRRVEPPAKLSDRNVIDLVGEAYSPLASPYGVIHQDLLRPGAQRTQLQCIISAYQYFSSESDEKHAKARDCAEALVKAGSQLPAVYAMLTFLYLDEHREGRNRMQDDPVEAAERMAGKAVEFGPQSARAHQALFAVYKVQGKREPARRAAEAALALNPYDTDILGDYAAWLISIGDFKEGRKWMARANHLLPAPPAWQVFYDFLGAELSGDHEAADNIGILMDARRSPLQAVAVAIGAHRRGESEKVKSALEELISSAPGFTKSPVGEFINRGFDLAVANMVADRLLDAGLETDPPLPD